MSGKSKYPPLHIALLLFSVTIIIANDNKWKVSSYSGDAPKAYKINKCLMYLHFFGLTLLAGLPLLI